MTTGPSLTWPVAGFTALTVIVMLFDCRSGVVTASAD